MRFCCLAADDWPGKVPQRFGSGGRGALRGYSPAKCSKANVGATLEDGQARNRRPDQIDLPVLWLLVRGVQILLTVFYAKATYLSLGTDFFVLDLLALIGMLTIIWLLLRGVATGTADSAGIHYRLYFRTKTVEWSDVQGIASAPPYSRWILRIFLGFGALFVLVLLWRIRSAPSPVSH